MEDVATLFRPVGARELELIRQTGFTAFPPRLNGQPIFYPVLDEDYAAQIARDWNTRDHNHNMLDMSCVFAFALNFLLDTRSMKLAARGVENIGSLPKTFRNSIATSSA